MSSYYLATASNVIKTFELIGIDPVTDLRQNIESSTTTSNISGIDDSNDLSSVCWNHTNQVLAFGGNDCKISLIQASNGQLLTKLPLNDKDVTINDPITSLKFSGNSRYIAAATAILAFNKLPQCLLIGSARGLAQQAVQLSLIISRS